MALGRLALHALRDEHGAQLEVVTEWLRRNPVISEADRKLIEAHLRQSSDAIARKEGHDAE